MPSAPSRARKQRARVHPVALRGAVREAIFERILSSRLTPGSSVGEVALGKALGASRTPLREALIELQAEGLIEHDPGRGFIVPPLSAQELREVYPIIAKLDALAAELAPARDAALVERLREWNRRLALAKNTKRITADAGWHDALAAATGNERLRQALRSLRRTVQRYEVAYMSDPALVRRSVREHEAIAAALARGAGAHAARLLHAHWQDSIGRLLDLLGRTQRVRP